MNTMLETVNLRKVYKPKKGVPVTALDGVSLKFPERGMVFLLGKSGSGKSTLLNLLGGLDSYDEGEIIIKGVSSRDFSQERFDSYRNTYVGFIFQDYNILEEFNVGANIALALELQGKKATDAEINRILDEVDLTGYGNRRPNELSGGQLQRVAIARALVKNPEIIMADEPTGALDSNTGKQVFDTLKKLSAEKLVIIVSHDREYAEYYADRIIELADGRVISDVEHTPEDDMRGDTLDFSGDTVTIPQGYHLTEEDRASINEYIDKLRSGARLSISGIRKKFHDTDTSRLPEQDPSKFALIKSRLPLKSAFRIGASGLKYKKFRLFVTVMLSVVAFSLFALTDTFGAYNNISACTESLLSSDISYLSLQKQKKVVYGSGPNDNFWNGGRFNISKDDISKIEDELGIDLKGAFVPRDAFLSVSSMLNGEKLTRLHSTEFTGFVELADKDLTELGYKLAAGRLPDGKKDEIALTSYSAESFVLGGFIRTDGGEGSVSYDKISTPADLVGRKLTLAGTEYEIVGIVDTGFNFERYSPLTDENVREDSIGTYMLSRELHYSMNFSFHTAVFVGEGKIDELIANEPPEIFLSETNVYMGADDGDISFNIDPNSIGKLDDLKDVKDIDGNGIGAHITWADGKERDKLADNEVIVTENILQIYESYQSGSNGYMESKDISEVGYDKLFGAEFNGSAYDPFGGDDRQEFSEMRVVGVIDTASLDGFRSYGAMYVGDGLYETFAEENSGEYTLALGAMPKGRSDIEKTVRFCYNDEADERFAMMNPITYELDNINDILSTLASVFVWIGAGFAVFAAVMLANFIGTSIAYKKQEIGILRAIGSRSSDVFHIFFAEAFIIAAVDFLLSAIGTFAVTAIINWYVTHEFGILVHILSFGLRQVALILAVSLGIAALACFLPVKKIASKRPIDAIRGR